jgi:hypothetical protein
MSNRLLMCVCVYWIGSSVVCMYVRMYVCIGSNVQCVFVCVCVCVYWIGSSVVCVCMYVCMYV